MRPSEPEFAVEAGPTGRLRAEGTVPTDLAVLEGHFPGHPIVPGFAQVEWARLLAARHLGAAAPIGGFRGLKFPAALLPGADVRVEIEAQADGFKFEVRSDGTVTCTGRARLAPDLAAHVRIDPQGDGRAAASGLHPLRLPHAGPMRLLSGVADHAPTTTTCLAAVTAKAPLAAPDGTVSVCLAIELMAQAMAAHGGLGVPGGTPPRRGFLVAARQVAFRTAALQVGEVLWSRADHVRGDTGMVAFRCTLGNGAIPVDEAEALGRALAHGTLGAFIEPGA